MKHNLSPTIHACFFLPEVFAKASHFLVSVSELKLTSLSKKSQRLQMRIVDTQGD